MSCPIWCYLVELMQTVRVALHCSDLCQQVLTPGRSRQLEGLCLAHRTQAHRQPCTGVVALPSTLMMVQAMPRVRPLTRASLRARDLERK